MRSCSQGEELYVDVIDADLTFSGLIDVFQVDLLPADLVLGADMTLPRNYTGAYSRATIRLSFQLDCLPGFGGKECLSMSICDPAPCDNGGLCEPDAAMGFICTCVGGFTGRSCDITLNCYTALNVDCNNGTCVDGGDSFSCTCDPGYTGPFCEERVDSSPSPSPTSPGTPSPGSSVGVGNTEKNLGTSGDNNGGGVAGAVVGSILVTVLMTSITLAIILFVILRSTKIRIKFSHKDKTSKGNAFTEHMQVVIG